MKTLKNGMSDQEFITAFEHLTLDPVYFDHLGHLRIAWLYLTRYELESAVELVCGGIKRYAESLGASNKFHLTMTDALVRIMAKRIVMLDRQEWGSFLDSNLDLVEDFRAVLHQFYAPGTLAAERARHSLIAPDLRPI